MKLCRPAIITKFVGPTDFRGSRITCRALEHRLTVTWDHALGVRDNHDAAARAFALKFDYSGEMLGAGEMPDGTGYAYIIRPRAVR